MSDYYPQEERFVYSIEDKIDWLVFDMNNLMWRMFYPIISSQGTSRRFLDNIESELTVRQIFEINWQNAMLNFITNKTNMVKPRKGVICLYDKGKSWRCDLYPEYKGTRSSEDENYPKHGISKFEFLKFADEFYDDLHKSNPRIYRMLFPSIEADDSIGWMVKNFPMDNFHFVSKDSDMYQLYKYPNYVQSLNVDDVYHIPNPVRVLEDKIIHGDKQSDNIPPIKARLRKDAVQKLRDENKLMEFITSDPEINSNFERNKKLIDLSLIPAHICSVISKMFNDVRFNNIEFDGMEFWGFLARRKLSKVMDFTMRPFIDTMSRLIDPVTGHDQYQPVLETIEEIPIPVVIIEPIEPVSVIESPQKPVKGRKTKVNVVEPRDWTNSLW